MKTESCALSGPKLIAFYLILWFSILGLLTKTLCIMIYLKSNVMFADWKMYAFHFTTFLWWIREFFCQAVGVKLEGKELQIVYSLYQMKLNYNRLSASKIQCTLANMFNGKLILACVLAYFAVFHQHWKVNSWEQNVLIPHHSFWQQAVCFSFL